MAKTGGSKGLGRGEDNAWRPHQLHSWSHEGIQKEECLKSIACPKCQQRAAEVINAGNQLRTGWYCGMCRHFEPAIRRERML